MTHYQLIIIFSLIHMTQLIFTILQALLQLNYKIILLQTIQLQLQQQQTIKILINLQYLVLILEKQLHFNKHLMDQDQEHHIIDHQIQLKIL